MKTTLTGLLLAFGCILADGSNAQTWTFDNSSSVTFIPTGSFNYNPVVPNFRFNYGSAHSSAAFQWSSQDANGHPGSGSIEASLTLNEALDTTNTDGAFVVDVAGGSGLSASFLSFDLMIAPGSAMDQYGGYGDLGIFTLTGGWSAYNKVWDGPSPETNYEFGTSWGVPYTAGTWYHFYIPLTGAADTNINAISIQDYDGGTKIINGTIQFFIDNLTLVTATQSITLQPGADFVGCEINGGGNDINNPSFLQVPSQLSGSVELDVFPCNSLNGTAPYNAYYWFDAADAYPEPAGWEDEIGNYVTNVVWSPGEGVRLINYLGSAATLTLSGTAPSGIFPPTSYCGCAEWSLLSSQVNSATNTFQSVTGFAPSGGAQAAIWNGSSFVTNVFTKGLWVPSVPILTNSQAGLFFVPCQANSAPIITSQPLSTTNYAGTTASFSVAASGTPLPIYQWKLNGTNLTDNGHVSGSQTTNLTISSVLMSDAGAYSVQVSNSAGSTNSNPAILTVLKATPILTWSTPAAITYGTALGGGQLNASANVSGANAYHPAAGTVLSAGTNNLGDVFTPTDTVDYNMVTGAVSLVVLRAPLSVTASNVSRAYGQTNPPLPVGIVGLHNGDVITGIGTCTATTNSPPGTYPIVPALLDPGNRLFNYSVTTNDGTLTVTCPAIALSPSLLPNAVASNAYSQTISASGSTGPYSFAVTAGALPSGFSLSSSGVLSGTNVVAGTNTFTIRATDSFGCTGSQSFTLITLAPPAISAPPQSESVVAGSNAVFTVTASGTGPLSYQWYFNGTALIAGGQFIGVNSNVLTIPVVQPTNAGGYNVIVTNIAGSATSSIATLNVILPPDLAPVSVLAPNALTNSHPNPAVSITWAVTNQGTGTASGSWKDRVWFSTNGVLDANSVSLGDFAYSQSVPAGGDYAQTHTVTLPMSASDNYTLFVQVNAGDTLYESSYANNVSLPVSGTFTLAPPDLQVLSVSVPPQAWTGRSFAVSYVLTNSGTGVAAGPWDDRIYLSATNQLRTNVDEVLGDFQFEGQLAPGQSVELIEPVTINSTGVTNGFYYVSVVADFSNDVFEVTKTNNVGVSASNILVQITLQPALVVTSVDAPTNGIGGQPVGVSWIVCNQGQADTEFPVWYDHLYLSTTTNLSGVIVDYGEYENASYLLVGDCYEQDVTVTLPVGISGPFYFIVNADSTGELEENDVTNNIGSTPSPINVQLVTAGFLHVVSVQVAPAPPTAVWADSQVTITWTVQNIGQTAITGTWGDTAALSPTPVYDYQHGYPHVLGEGVSFRGPLEPGQSYTNSGQFIVPEGITTGDWYVVPILDLAQQAVSGPSGVEVGRDQNSTLLIVSNAPPADLVVTSVTAPAVGYAGQSINVSWAVNNQGLNRTAASSWYDGIYLSTNGFFDTNQNLLLGYIANWGALNVGASYTNTQSVILPASLLPYGASNATYSVFVDSDVFNSVYEITKTNNVLEATNQLTVLPPPPPTPADLAVTSVSAPSTILAGGPANIFWTVSNLGSSVTSATNWVDSVYLSTDRTLSNAIWIAAIPHGGALAPGASYTVAQNLDTPYCTRGTYYVVVLADSGYQVNQSGIVTNNVLASPNRMHILPNGAARLEVSSVSSAGSVIAGAPLPVSWTVSNLGNREATGQWIDGVFLSPNAVYSPGSGFLLGLYTNHSNLGFGQDYTESQSYVVPPCLGGTNYYVAVVTDLSNIVDSISCDTNNATTSSAPVQVLPEAYPSLQINGMSVPATITSGVPFVVQWTVTNAGTAAATNTWYDAVYASLSPTLDASGLFLGEFAHAGLASGGTYTQSQSAQIPACIAGSYYIFVAADISNVVNAMECEVDDLVRSTNAVPVTVAAYPQLSIGSVSVPATGGSGQPMTVSWTETNSGPGVANAPWVDAVYLTANGIFNPASDPLLGYYTNTTSIAPGTSIMESSSFNIPNVYGNFYAAVLADAAFSVFQCDGESNRVAVSASPVDVPRTLYPHLRVTSVKVPATALAGQPITVTWVVTNDGTDATGGTTWNDGVFLSAGEVLDSSDTRLGTFGNVKSLGTGQSYTNSQTIAIPPGYAGPYYILVLADSGDLLYEPLGYNDSLGWNPDAMIVTLPTPIQLAPSNVTLTPATGTPGTQTTIGWTVSNDTTNSSGSVWTDAIYVSTNTVWDLTATLVADVNRTGLGALSSYSGSWTGALPALTPGSYHAIVRTDVRDTAPEISLSNLVAVSSSTISVDVPVIVLGETVTNSLTTGDAQYYKVNCSAGQTVSVTLTGASTNSFNEVYVRFGGVPDLGNYDFIYNNPMAPNQQITIPATQAGWYYIMVRGGNEPNGPLAYSLTANIVPFAITSVTPPHIGDNGQVTISVNGSQFQPGASVQLVSGTSIYAATTNFFDSATLVRARFFFTNAVHGTYDVVLTNPSNQSTTANQSITIETALPLTAQIIPGLVNNLPRQGTSFAWTGSAINTGNLDINYLTVAIEIDQALPINLSLPSQAVTSDNSPGIFVVRDIAPGADPSFSFQIPGFGSEQFHYLVVPGMQSKKDFLQEVADQAEAVRESILTNPAALLMATNTAPLPTNALVALSNTNTWAMWFGHDLITTGLLDTNDLNGLPSPSPQMTVGGSYSALRGVLPAISCPQCGVNRADCDNAFWLAYLACEHQNCDNSVWGCIGCTTGELLGYAYCQARYFGCLFTCGTPPQQPCGENYTVNTGNGTVSGLPFSPLVSAGSPGSGGSSGSGGSVCNPASGDPNAKQAPTGFGPSAFVGSQPPWLYTIYFANESNATAFARQISISDPLDPSVDIRSFRVGNIVIGNTTIAVPTNSTYFQTRIALPPPNPPNVVADITAGVDVQNHSLFWTMNAIDLNTGQLVTGAQEGVLPPNTTNNIGAGYVTFSIKPAAGVPTGTVVTNQATIVFDINDPIPTDTTTNTVDAVPPTSIVATLPPVTSSNTFMVYWGGSDDAGGSGIASFNIYFSDDDGPYQLWQAGSTFNSAQFTGQFGHTYAFYSTAQDNSGNVEATHTTADTTTQVSSPPVIAPVSDETINPGGSITITNIVSDADQPAPTLTYSLGPNAPVGASINPTNGVFTWTPDCAQGSTTNLIQILVTASDDPSFSNSVLFNIIVADCVQVGVGSTVVRTGQSASIPLNLFTTVGLTNLSFTLVYPTNRFTNWTILATNPAGSTGLVGTLGPSNTFFTVTTPMGQPLQGPTVAGSLTFSALPGESAFVPLSVTGVAGTKADGSPAGNISGVPGRVVIIGPQPLLEAGLGSNSTRILTLYGNPGTNYQFLISTNLLSTNWQAGTNVTLTNLFEYFNADQSAPLIFYRAH